MFNAYDYNFKHKLIESQENYSWRVWLSFRVGKGFSDHFTGTWVIGRALSFFIQREVKLVVIILFLSLFINFILINGRAFFMAAATP